MAANRFLRFALAALGLLLGALLPALPAQAAPTPEEAVLPYPCSPTPSPLATSTPAPSGPAVP